MSGEIIQDPDAFFVRRLQELAAAIRYTTGQEAEIIIWPRGVPLTALAPGNGGSYAGMRVTAPKEAIGELRRSRPFGEFT